MLARQNKLNYSEVGAKSCGAILVVVIVVVFYNYFYEESWISAVLEGIAL